MSEAWLQRYIFLAFRLHKAIENAYHSPFVEDYWGPLLWRERIEAEPETAPADIVRQAMMLADALPVQGFSPNRMAYLGANLRAMETLARKLCGETFTLLEESQRCLDISPLWTPETQFEQAHALYKKTVSGAPSSLAEQVRTYQQRAAFPQKSSDLLKEVIQQAIALARKRTATLLALPEEENIETHYFLDKEYDAAARYQGNYRTRIEMNLTATAAWFSRLFDHKICHEGYPGHHTEYVLKDQHLARRGYIEQTLYLTLVPQCVISEGIAIVAHEMVFAEGEAEQWVAQCLSQLFQRGVDPVALLHLRQARNLLEGVWGNAAILLDEGHSEAEVAQYFVKYMLVPEDRAFSFVADLKHPLYGLHTALTYAIGQQLVRRWLQGTDRVAVFSRFLKEQWLPSQLAADMLPA